jgi:hypothetical protein
MMALVRSCCYLQYLFLILSTSSSKTCNTTGSFCYFTKTKTKQNKKQKENNNKQTGSCRSLCRHTSFLGSVGNLLWCFVGTAMFEPVTKHIFRPFGTFILTIFLRFLVEF